MTKNNKIALFVVLLLLAGGGFLLYNGKQQQKPIIKLSNHDPVNKTIDFEMSYQGQKVQGTATKGNIYEKTKGGITFVYEPTFVGSGDYDLGAPIEKTAFAIIDNTFDIVKQVIKEI